MEKLTKVSQTVGELLKERGDTIAVAESSAGGLISAALLSVAGASSYFIGGGVIYTLVARNALLPNPGDALEGVRSASEPYALWLARAVKEHLDATWGLAETGASGPSGNRYGDDPGHSCFAVSGPGEQVRTMETGIGDRQVNMWKFAEGALNFLEETMKDQ